MITMGFSFSTGDIRYVVLDGSGAQPEFVSKDRLIVPERPPAETAVWFETQIELLLDRHHPARIGFRATTSVTTLKQIQTSLYGQAILHLLCGQDAIPIQHFMPSSLVPSKLGRPKGSNLGQLVDEALGQHPPYWDDKTKDCALIAWILLGGER